jgi:hypothetical protein
MSADLVAFNYLVKKALGKLEGKFTDGVIHRWQNYRARKFLKEFAEAVAREAQGKGAAEEVDRSSQSHGNSCRKVSRYSMTFFPVKPRLRLC